MIRRIVSPAVPEPAPGSFSNCLVVGDTVYLSGLHAGAEAAGMTVAQQTAKVLGMIEALVNAAGATKQDIVKLTIYLTDVGTRAEVSQARREFFTGDFPCSTLVGIAALAAPGAAVEIDAVAIVGASTH
ncbi:MAG: RidA family protein [Rhodospirillales bacterium]|jgi:2-iminobutanoate/2-iminopropanoate deaminase|nr:RidA family protein [Rhodospirillales bacterium]